MTSATTTTIPVPTMSVRGEKPANFFLFIDAFRDGGDDVGYWHGWFVGGKRATLSS